MSTLLLIVVASGEVMLVRYIGAWHFGHFKEVIIMATETREMFMFSLGASY